MEFHAVTNGKLPFSAVLHFMKEAGSKVDYLHIREKEKTAMEVFEGVMLLVQNGIPRRKIVMNDRVDVAAAAGISRVQLGYRSLSPFLVKKKWPELHAGKSVHSLEEAAAAEAEGADSVLFGHLFETGSKRALQPRGIEKAKEISNQLSIHVLGIGGILPEHIQDLAKADLDGICVMSGIWDSSNPAEAADQYRKALTRCKEATL
ncbi:thiazole tautomerase TenI [Bacillus sp. FJAT-42376]|uniref:thiamine phosphate synthase n=1 Tax=Bacillus sp. FJAT-42376 TaxID=2014076 RepID=UPI000F514E66|nr:thiamine phosphate synthase [Bacillus sp. FJAT-42376]AZB44177.1 thiazole tautomerase TenI [Bacillus sp. FJAT-42376]